MRCPGRPAPQVNGLEVCWVRRAVKEVGRVVWFSSAAGTERVVGETNLCTVSAQGSAVPRAELG